MFETRVSTMLEMCKAGSKALLASLFFFSNQGLLRFRSALSLVRCCCCFFLLHSAGLGLLCSDVLCFRSMFFGKDRFGLQMGFQFY